MPDSQFAVRLLLPRRMVPNGTAAFTELPRSLGRGREVTGSSRLHLHIFHICARSRQRPAPSMVSVFQSQCTVAANLRIARPEYADGLLLSARHACPNLYIPSSYTNLWACSKETKTLQSDCERHRYRQYTRRQGIYDPSPTHNISEGRSQLTCRAMYRKGVGRNRIRHPKEGHCDPHRVDPRFPPSAPASAA